MAAATIEIVFDGGFNDILLDYLDMQGRSSSEEAAFDDDASDYSSSGNDSDIVRAISADILRNGESIRCLGLQPASAPQPRAPRRLPSDSHSVGDAKRDNGCKCLIGDCIDNFGGEKFFLREQLMAVSTTCHMDLATSLGPWYFVKDCLCCELKCRFILVGLIVIKVFPRLVGLMTLLDHHHGKSIKINVSYKIGILDLI